MENSEQVETEVVSRLIKWLESHGCSPEEIVECLKYITEPEE